MNYQSSKQTIRILRCEVSMPPCRPSYIRFKSVCEVTSGSNWTLGDGRHAISPLSVSLRKAVPVYTRPLLGTINVVNDSYGYGIAQIGFDRRSWILAINDKKVARNPVGVERFSRKLEREVTRLWRLLSLVQSERLKVERP